MRELAPRHDEQVCQQKGKELSDVEIRGREAARCLLTTFAIEVNIHSTLLAVSRSSSSSFFTMAQ